MFKKYVIGGLACAILSSNAIAQEREWVLDAANEDVYLLFGVPNTADVGVSFWCKISTGVVSVFAPLPGDMHMPKSITMALGSATYELPTTPSDEADPKTIEAKLVPQDKILSDLETAERFSFTLGQHKAVYPLAGADFPALLKICYAKPAEPNN
jgi:hypothetical protein